MKFEPRKFVKLPCFMMLVAAGFLAGCQSVKEVLELDTSAELHIAASEDINPDADRRPSPVVLHIFKLTDDRQFRRQDFLSLYENAEARLGKELVGSRWFALRLRRFAAPGRDVGHCVSYRTCRCGARI